VKIREREQSRHNSRLYARSGTILCMDHSGKAPLLLLLSVHYLGHIASSFLVLRLEVDLQRRLDERKIQVAWPHPMRDLAQG
jgi:hypothetical protein